jgi:hemolysin III
MKKRIEATVYPPAEEKWNVITHGLGLLLSIAGLVLLVVKSSSYGNAWHIVSFSIYGVSMVLLYAASTFYHAAKDTDVRYRRNVFDHASIYILIAGTYTPFVLVTLNGAIGWVLFGIIWGLAIAGVILKIFFIGRYNLLSTIMYIVMGWLIIFAIRSIIQNLPIPGLVLLLVGGVSYTIGAVFFSIEKLPFNHAIFHFFVLGGTICHYLSIFFYVLEV